MRVNPRSNGVEIEHLPRNLNDLMALSGALRAHGHSRSFAAGVVDWVLAKRSGGGNDLSPDRKSAYRKALVALDVARADEMSIARAKRSPERPLERRETPAAPKGQPAPKRPASIKSAPNAGKSSAAR